MVNLKLGATWQESGLTKTIDGMSAGGNGTAMRAAPIGLFFRKEPEKLLESAMLDASITHNAWEPKMGSIAVALATAMLANGTATPQSVSYEVADILSDSEVKSKIQTAQKPCISRPLRRSASVAMFPRQWGGILLFRGHHQF